MDAEERTKKTNDLIEKFKKMPLSNRSTPRSSQHNSRESLDVLSSRESLNSHSHKVNFEIRVFAEMSAWEFFGHKFREIVGNRLFLDAYKNAYCTQYKITRLSSG